MPGTRSPGVPARIQDLARCKISLSVSSLPANATQMASFRESLMFKLRITVSMSVSTDVASRFKIPFTPISDAAIANAFRSLLLTNPNNETINATESSLQSNFVSIF